MVEACSSETAISTYKICGVRTQETAVWISKAFYVQKAGQAVA
jgi:hypothetical protein